MVKHIVMFRFFDEISAEERQAKVQEIKEKTEALKEQIAGIVPVSYTQLDGYKRQVLSWRYF